MPAEIDAYIAARPAEFAAALTALRAQLTALLPDHIEVMSYAMPGLREPTKGGKMVIGYAAYAHHIGVYPHSGSVIAKIDCAPYRTSKSGFTFAPNAPPPLSLLAQIIAMRQADIVAGYSTR